PLRAGVCPAIWRPGDPLRSQSVAVGAGDRTRSVGLERSYPARNARAHALSADRRIALYDHAGAVWLLLVRAAGARQVGTCRAIGGSRVRDPRRAGRRHLGVARPHQGRIRTRRAARLSVTHAMVSGAIVESHPADP